MCAIIAYSSTQHLACANVIEDLVLLFLFNFYFFCIFFRAPGARHGSLLRANVIENLVLLNRLDLCHHIEVGRVLKNFFFALGGCEGELLRALSPPQKKLRLYGGAIKAL
jgi:hypothetical protein